MISKLLDEYSIEKSNFKKLLIGFRMSQVSYCETFQLLFYQKLIRKNNWFEEIELVLTLDAPCWFGNRDEWITRIKELETGCAGEEKEDCLLAYELTRLRYWNLIDVEKVDFFEEFLAITFPQKNTLCIPYNSDADDTWILEEASEKREQDRMGICCEGNRLYQYNINPAILERIYDAGQYNV